MFENIKDGDLITLKLASGEEVIANYKSGADSYISIEKALVLMQGPQGLAFGTFFSTAQQDKPINIAKDKITSIAYINDKIKLMLSENKPEDSIKNFLIIKENLSKTEFNNIEFIDLRNIDKTVITFNK